MRLVVAAALLFAAAGLSAPVLCASALPACNTRVLQRRGDHVSMSMAELSRVLDQRLKAGHSHLSDLQITPGEKGGLKVSASKDGTPMSVSGPLQVVGGGTVQLHAEKITKNGNSVKGLMGIAGKNLNDYVQPGDVSALRVEGDNLDINVDRLLNLAGDVRNVQVRGSQIEMDFTSRPCR